MSADATTLLAVDTVDTVEGFGGDPWWLILLKVVVVVGFWRASRRLATLFTDPARPVATTGDRPFPEQQPTGWHLS